MTHTQILRPGDSINMTLPSGKIVNVEVTQDTASVTLDDNGLFNENLRGGRWLVDWPSGLAVSEE